MADVSKLDTLMRSMGEEVSEMEFKDMVKSLPVHGNKIPIRDLRDVLGSMGIELIEKMFSDLEEMLPVDDNKMVFQNRLLDEVKSLTGGKVDANNIDTILENMGIKLTETKLKDLKEALPVDDNIKTELTKLMDKVKTLTGGETDVNDVKSLLKKMVVDLKEKMLKLLKNLPVNENGTVYNNRLMDSLKSLNEGTVNADKLGSLLGRMGIKLEEKELEDLIQNLQHDVDENVALKKTMNEVRKISGEKVDINSLQNYLRSLGVELIDAECSELKKVLPTDASGKTYQNMVLDAVKSFKGGMVRLPDLDKALRNIGIELTEKEHKHLSDNLPVKGEPIDLTDLEDVLENMGVELMKKDVRTLLAKLRADHGSKTYWKRLLEYLKTFTADGKVDIKTMLNKAKVFTADGKVDIKTMMNKAKVFTGEKMDINNLENMLRKLGIELNDPEYMKLLKTLPVDGGKLDVKSLYSFLESMGINGLSKKEVEQLEKNLPVDSAPTNGKIDLIKVLDRAKAYTGEEIGVDDIKTVLENMGLEYKDQEFPKLMETLQFDDDGKIFQYRLLEKVKSLKEFSGGLG